MAKVGKVKSKNPSENKPKKWYAIKEGKGVKDKIVTSWKECSELVLGYNSIYKSFKTEEEAKRYLVSINDKCIPRIKEKNKMIMEKEKKRKIITKPLNGVRIPIELYDIIAAKAERDCVKLDSLVIEALEVFFE